MRHLQVLVLTFRRWNSADRRTYSQKDKYGHLLISFFYDFI